MPGAYYNENDPFAAAWLRNLIAAGHIAPGHVDERPIQHVRPADLAGYGQAHFFAGIGGWSRALRLAGWPDDAPVCLWTGSCPCQPFSAAGAGKAADDERHLWPHWFELIRVCRPAIILGEQVEAAIGWGWLDTVCADLGAQGYTTRSAVLPAAGVGAFHIRARLWFVADTECRTAERHRSQLAGAPLGDQGDRDQRQRIRDDARHGGTTLDDAVVDPEREGLEGHRPPEQLELFAGARALRPVGEASPTDRLANPGCLRAGRPSGSRREESRRQARALGEPAGSGHPRTVANPDGRDASAEGLQRGGQHRLQPQDSGARDHSSMDDALGEGISGMGHAADANGRTGERGTQAGIRTDGERRGRPTSASLDGGMADPERDGGRPDQPWWRPQRRETHGWLDFWSDAEWIACSDGKARPIKPGIQPLAHGVPARMGKLRAAGNAIVPQAAALFIRAALFEQEQED